MPDIHLEGCSPEPLAHYLKALGILRLVSEQADPDARGFWDGDSFVLRSRLDAAALVEFFADRYAPTPLVSPWNGGSGFFPGDQRSGIDAITGSDSARFALYRAAITGARRVLAQLGLTTKPSPDQKPRLVEHLRGDLDDDALAWLDAALVLTDDGLRFPPLLGTGGNDGRLEFANNFMQRLSELVLGSPEAALLRGALFGDPTPNLAKGKAIGQFLPAGVGGANAGSGFSRDSFVNPWDFVLMLEGALLFAAGVTRRLEAATPGTMVFPFTVRASACGYTSNASSDEQETRDELWLPLWRAPASSAELRALLSEGRAKVRLADARGATSRSVGTGVDFARAITGLGVARGLHSFARYGFHVRNGLSYLATPLGRWRVPDRPGEHVELLTPLDRWLDRFRRVATGTHAPASHGRALRRLESAILRLCQEGTPHAVQAVLIALGEAEAALARTPGDATLQGLRPVSLLPAIWLERADDGSPEFRLAAALASTDLRARLVRVRRGDWLPRGQNDGRTVWGEGDLVRNFLAVLLRADVERAQSSTCESPVPRDMSSPRFAALTDIATFIDARTDDLHLEALARGLSLVDWRRTSPASRTPRGAAPPASFAALALAHTWGPEGQPLRRTPGMLARAAAGDLHGAIAFALRRLQGQGLETRHLADLDAPLAHRGRLAAALIFPLGPRAHDILLDQLFPRLMATAPVTSEESTA